MKTPEIIVIGAGASGITAAIQAAKRGLKVTILEANEKPGKKIYATGNGKCNLTNAKMDISCFRGSNPEFINNVISRFNYQDTIKYFSELGLMFKDKNGYLYPASGQASSVVEALVTECRRLDIKILCQLKIEKLYKNKNKFIVVTDNDKFMADAVILACGSFAGISEKKLPNVSGYDMAKQFGHKIIPLVSALTGMRCRNKSFYKKSAGVRCDGEIQLYSEGKLMGSDVGELQLTDYGISGIPVFQLARYASYSIRNKKETCIRADFMPSVTENELKKVLRAKIDRNPECRMSEYMNGIINDKLSAALLEYAGINADKKGKLISDDELLRLVYCIKNYKDYVMEINGFQAAQVLAGGVSLDEINENMESVYEKNLFITGELLDADGICGGYNLQWAWATGYIAGNEVFK